MNLNLLLQAALYTAGFICLVVLFVWLLLRIRTAILRRLIAMVLLLWA